MTDLSGVVNEQKATIETLRRRVAELEKERDYARESAEQQCQIRYLYHDENDHHKETIATLTAENAELKRQVEALREAVTAILEGEMPDYKSQEEFGGYVLDDSIREKAKAALREAAKEGGVEAPKSKCRKCGDEAITGRLCYDHAKACPDCGGPLDPLESHDCGQQEGEVEG